MTAPPINLVAGVGGYHQKTKSEGVANPSLANQQLVKGGFMMGYANVTSNTTTNSAGKN